ncbi:hypothetical protein BLS_000034 [Venturia inaequalis]|uniref:DUF625-domain-containing protein n=1 Tax=Venturia inaequalis TaxID=5025 RepID=A0A8H3VCP0_VENIN|nr:hypothetical protein EG328_006066 [Venturia inaequalis]KAE9986101.1 hypothetical protein BLS_000034 [Venturia inaequalis]KAE9991458.1 hypothetical protein EG327_011620 [Venturia inaequalis]RDI81587.1 hypothetical protein Vi05172_g8328 [Venturia inaequalis]
MDTNERKRVKVYELKANDWFDRGTGFCTGTVINDEARIHVQSEDEPDRTLLETKIAKDDGYQKQQDTLIVWTESNVTDMALSFQEPEGCAAIWDFVSEAQQRLGGNPGIVDDGVDDTADTVQPFALPAPELGNLAEIESTMRMANSTAQGREALTKFTLASDLISKLVPLVEMAEDLESLADLHRLCNIMKTLILLNDTAIIENVVMDDVVIGVVGALEYDPDFPSHKANHRQYLKDTTRFKEVVRIEAPMIRKKIHYTYRLQYLKDVVLARILDDPTFSVLNSLIFFHQVDIVQHVQSNGQFLKELFSIFNPTELNFQRKKDAVIFIQQCCTIAKGLQANTRQQLYQNFIGSGLLGVIIFALKHTDPSVRVAGTEILMALIDHDPLAMRGNIFKAVADHQQPLTDILIELLLVEEDQGVKTQMADAIKILLDPTANAQSIEAIVGRANGDFLAKVRNGSSQPDSFILDFYNDSAKKLFRPLKDLEHKSVADLTTQEVSLYVHLVEVLCFFVRQHAYRSKYFLLQDNLPERVAQLLSSPTKHLRLTALKYFRTCIGLHDDFHNRQIISNGIFEPILNIVYETMPRDNLLNSACLEFFEFIKRENMKALTINLVEQYRQKLEGITYVETFKNLIEKYEKYTAPQPENISFTSVDTEQTQSRAVVNGGRWGQELKAPDHEEEAYFNGVGDDEEDDEFSAISKSKSTNGVSVMKPLVNYTDDDDDGTMDILAQDPSTAISGETSSDLPRETIETIPVPERLAEKRRREEEDEDELSKLSAKPGKRRSSSISSIGSAPSTHAQTLRRDSRKRSFSSGKDGPPQKISISLAVKSGNENAQSESE